jgi:hypothetical protein
MKDHHMPGRKRRAVSARPSPYRLVRRKSPAAWSVRVTVTAPATVTIAVPVAALAWGPTVVLGVAAAAAAVCWALVLLVRFAIDREDRFARLSAFAGMLWPLASAGPGDSVAGGTREPGRCGD